MVIAELIFSVLFFSSVALGNAGPFGGPPNGGPNDDSGEGPGGAAGGAAAAPAPPNGHQPWLVYAHV